jgi:beta-glucanase (GH16 family)
MSLSRTDDGSVMEQIPDGLPLARMIVSDSRPISLPPENFKFTHNLFADTNMALHYYSADNAVTSNGVLNITTELKDNTYRAFNETTKQFFADKKHVQSGMLQSWNKFCFIGGIVEISAKLPGDPHIGGLWPACT